ncbi:MAG: hypothetical protein P8166_00495 [Candidatus Thiodiazotropha sp.]|jgi:hypothetical protein
MAKIFPHANFLLRRLDAGFFKHWIELGRQAVGRLANAGLRSALHNRSDLATVPVIHASYATGGGTGTKLGAVLNLFLNMDCRLEVCDEA